MKLVEHQQCSTTIWPRSTMFIIAHSARSQFPLVPTKAQRTFCEPSLVSKVVHSLFRHAHATFGKSCITWFDKRPTLKQQDIKSQCSIAIVCQVFSKSWWVWRSFSLRPHPSTPSRDITRYLGMTPSWSPAELTPCPTKLVTLLCLATLSFSEVIMIKQLASSKAGQFDIWKALAYWGCHA